MRIGEVIRKYRKEKQLTQEEMANYLGITAPAVNKWENGNSSPDISLLAPIARLLGISTDILLSYQEDLTEKEIELHGSENIVFMLKRGFEEDGSIDFLRDDERFQALLKELQKTAGKNESNF